MTSTVVLVLDGFGEAVYVPVTQVDAELDMEIDAEIDLEVTAEEAPLA